MQSTRNFLIFIVGLLLASLFAVFTAVAQEPEIIINDTPLSEVTFDIVAEVKDEVSSGVISDLDNKNVVVVSDSVVIKKLVKDITKQSNKIEIELKQQQIFELQNKYEQVKDLVNVYESSDGFGYQVVETLKDKIIYTGYGVDSDKYTYTISFSDLPISALDNLR